MQQTILLTGASGFLGSHLLEALLRHGHKVVILKRATSNTWRIQHLLERIKSYDVDVEPLEVAFEQQRIDAVIHTACHYGRNAERLDRVVESNLVFGLRVLEGALRGGAKAFLNTDTFFNSGAGLQHHLSAYTLCKKQFVEWLHLHSEGIQVVNLKLQHVYGGRDESTKFIPWVVSQLKDKAPVIKLTKGEQLRDFVYVDDVVSAYLTVLNAKLGLPKFSSFDVGSGVLTSVRSMVESIKKTNDRISRGDETKLEFGALPYGQGEIMTVDVDNSSLRRLGWVGKVSLQEGINRLFAAEINKS